MRFSPSNPTSNGAVPVLPVGVRSRSVYITPPQGFAVSYSDNQNSHLGVRSGAQHRPVQWTADGGVVAILYQTAGQTTPSPQPASADRADPGFDAGFIGESGSTAHAAPVEVAEALRCFEIELKQTSGEGPNALVFPFTSFRVQELGVKLARAVYGLLDLVDLHIVAVGSGQVIESGCLDRFDTVNLKPSCRLRHRHQLIDHGGSFSLGQGTQVVRGVDASLIQELCDKGALLIAGRGLLCGLNGHGQLHQPIDLGGATALGSDPDRIERQSPLGTQALDESYLLVRGGVVAEGAVLVAGESGLGALEIGLLDGGLAVVLARFSLLGAVKIVSLTPFGRFRFQVAGGAGVAGETGVFSTAADARVGCLARYAVGHGDGGGALHTPNFTS